MRHLFFILFIITSTFSQTLEILFEQRKPYVSKQADSLEGVVAIPLIQSLENTKIDFTLKELPSKRHLSEIKSNQKPVCAIGWFKNKTREEFAKFTAPLYQDKPMGILTRVDHPTIKEGLTIENLLSNEAYTMLGKVSYSYGEFIDKKLTLHNTKKREVNSDNINMFTLIAFRRADFMFVSYEEATEILTSHPNTELLKFVPLENMPQGNKRYLICSKKVDEKTIDLINRNLP
jgi:uncharacterized protein (TIGR02285 family)